MTTDERREYTEAMVMCAGLSPAASELAMAAAMSLDDDLCDDDFEVAVDAIIEGAEESTR